MDVRLDYSDIKSLIEILTSDTTKLNDYLTFIDPSDVSAIVINGVTIPIQ